MTYATSIPIERLLYLLWTRSRLEWHEQTSDSVFKTLFHLRVQDNDGGDFWLDLEMCGDAPLGQTGSLICGRSGWNVVDAGAGFGVFVGSD